MENPEWHAADAVRRDAYEACKVVDLGSIVNLYEDTIILYEQLQLMNSMFRDLGPSDLAQRTQAARQHIETFGKALKFMRNNRIEGPERWRRLRSMRSRRCELARRFVQGFSNRRAFLT